MKRKEWRYTEYSINMEPTDSLSWLKLILIYVVVSPLRLVNEISQKVLFLGVDILRKVVIYAIAINCGFIVWSLFWSVVSSNKPYIPFPVMFISTGLTIFVYIYLGNMKDFEYEMVDGVDEESEEQQLNFDPEEIVAFEKIAAAEVTFNESINIFIKDPEELTALGINPAVYQEAEDVRLLNALEQKTDIFPYDKIELPDLFEESSLGSQLEDNFNSLMNDLEQQLKNI